MADVIGQDDEKLRCIERLARAEKFPGELRPNELRATAGGAVHDENGILCHAFGVFDRLAERCGNAAAAPAAFRRRQT